MPHAEKVLASQTEDALALTYAGHHIAYIGREYQKGLTTLKRAAALNPNSGTTEMLLGWVNIYMNENEAAIAHLNRAERLSPLHPHIAILHGGIGNAYFQMGQPERAVAFYEQAMIEYPEFASNQLLLIGCYWELGRRTDAAWMADWLRAKVPDMTVQTFVETRPQHSVDFRAQMVAALRATGFPDQ